MRRFEAEKFMGKWNIPQKEKLEIFMFYTALISNFHIVSEGKALQLSRISILLEENGIFQ